MAAIGVPFFTLAEAPPARIDISSIPAQMVEDVIIPSRKFSLRSTSWETELAEAPFETGREINANRSRTALLFGLVISEGFIAVQAEDREEVKRIGRDVLNLSGALWGERRGPDTPTPLWKGPNRETGKR